eukprot:1540272-Amphidinium_carterae.1
MEETTTQDDEMGKERIHSDMMTIAYCQFHAENSAIWWKATSHYLSELLVEDGTYWAHCSNTSLKCSIDR